jgi:hypothetical protein
MKRSLYFFTLAVLWQQAYAGDILTGTTFSDGQTVTAALLNNAVNNATIQPAFISGQGSASPASTDQIVFYQTSGGTLKKSTLSNLLALAWASPVFTGTLVSSQATVIIGMLTPATVTADVNDYNPTGLATSTTLRLASDNLGVRNITGIAGGADGRLLLLHNIGTTDNLVLKNANSSSTAANRFAFVGDRTILPNGVLILQYDGTSSRWRTTQKNATDDVTIAPTFAALTYGTTTTLACNPINVSQNASVTLTGNTQLIFTGLVAGMTGELRITQDGTGTRKVSLPGPSFTDGVGTTSTTFTSATGAFVASDAGGPINEPGNTHIPVGTTIASVTNGTTIVASASISTGTGITFYLPNRQSKVIGGGRGAVSLTTTANALDDLAWSYDGTNIVWTGGKNAN